MERQEDSATELQASAPSKKKAETLTKGAEIQTKRPNHRAKETRKKRNRREKRRRGPPACTDSLCDSGKS
jgi:hypothetical protein